LTEKSPADGFKGGSEFFKQNQRAFTPLGVITTAASEEVVNPNSYS
jgi:hypothetical protein